MTEEELKAWYELEDWYNNYGYVPDEDKNCGPNKAIQSDK